MFRSLSLRLKRDSQAPALGITVERRPHTNEDLLVLGRKDPAVIRGGAGVPQFDVFGDVENLLSHPFERSRGRGLGGAILSQSASARSVPFGALWPRQAVLMRNSGAPILE